MNLPPVSAKAFAAIQNLNITELAKCSQREIRPFLPSLVRQALLSAIDSVVRSKCGGDIRKQILSLLVGIEAVNSIVSLLQESYHELESEVKKEQQLRQKIGNSNQDTAQIHGLQNGVALGFERADVTRKVRIVLSELFYIQSQIYEQNQQTTKTPNDNIVKQSELFDNEIYLEEITDIICIALAELPSLFNIQEVVETLLYVNNGSSIICWVVANMPDCFKDVVTSLISNADEDSPDGKLRAQALYALCELNPGQAIPTRTLCVEMSKMPSLMLKLSLKDPLDLIAFISGLLLGNDQNTRSWFAVFVRNSQKRKGDALNAVREELLKQLQSLDGFSAKTEFTDECVVQGASLLRLYCALRGIAGIKFNDEEINSLINLITSKPPPTSAGIRFVSIGLCMLIACPSLLSQPSLEAKGIEWVQWLIKEEPYFLSNCGVSASFGEMLLLMAIHFHGNQVSAIGELVCSTLGMKIPLRQNNTSRMKQIFTQEIFTEQVVTAHAIKVPVTLNLNATIPGYLPVHCIHQLLKSRAFSKHKVPIKSWIYKQICNSTTPLHPVLPALIEVYVNSIILPTAKGPSEHTHKPLTEEEIVKVFQNSVFGMHLNDMKKKTVSNDEDNNLSNVSSSSITVTPEPMETVNVSETQKSIDVTTLISPSPLATSAFRSLVNKSKKPDESRNKLKLLSTMTSQLLILYYILLYEDVRLYNMSTILAANRKVKSYSTEFLAELPIKYLLQQAQRNQKDFSGLFSPLLRLLVTHFPHLTLVDDWLEEEMIYNKKTYNIPLQQYHIIDAFEDIEKCPSKVIKVLKLMLKKTPTDLWIFAEIFTKYFRNILDDKTPRLLQDLYKQVWIRLNTVLPRRLWALTINALMPSDDVLVKHNQIAQESTLIDPLQILRCDERVFRCPEATTIVLRILQASLAASKSELVRHQSGKPIMGTEPTREVEREEIKAALGAAQDTAAVQILLEACLETEEDCKMPGRKWALREIRCIICSYVHQVFISNPSLAKMIHFQGYARELLPVTVRGIPSMHICIDFVPELLTMREMNKQIFAIDLTSHLGLRYALPKSLSVAKLCINTLSTLLGVLSSDTRIIMFRAVLPSVVRFAEAFPPLIEDCVMFLMQLGRIAVSQASLGRSNSLPSILPANPESRIRTQTQQSQYTDKLVEEVRETFSKLLDEAVLKPKIY